MFLKRPFQFGSITLPSNIFCAPLAGCTDLPFRKTIIQYQPGLNFCEMVKMEALIHRNLQTKRLLDFDPTMHPIGAQLCGSKLEIAGECAKMIEDLGFDVVDLNCGCPVDKITKDGSGSAMLKNPELIGKIVSRMVSCVKIPVTVKIRIGWDSKSIVAPLVTRIVEEAGATALTIHGRTQAQSYGDPVNYPLIRECKEQAKKMLVIGNGGIFDASLAEKMFTETGCDGILLSRGLLGQPWLVEDIYRHLSKEPSIKRGGIALRNAFLEHLEHIVSYQNEVRALLDLRRVGCWFFRDQRGVKELREKLNHTQSVSEVRKLVDSYPWA